MGSEGFDPKRPRPGVVIHYKSEAKLKQLVEDNLAASRDDPHMPPVLPDRMAYAALGGNHMTTGLRLFRHSVPKASGGGNFCVGDDKELAAVVEHGHKYIVLREDIPDEDARLVCEWLNSDQNQNSGNSEIQLLAQIQSVLRLIV